MTKLQNLHLPFRRTEEECAFTILWSSRTCLSQGPSAIHQFRICILDMAMFLIEMLEKAQQRMSLFVPSGIYRIPQEDRQ